MWFIKLKFIYQKDTKVNLYSEINFIVKYRKRKKSDDTQSIKSCS